MNLRKEPLEIDASSLSADEIFKLLSGSQNGLSESEAKKRLLDYGENKLLEKDKKSRFQIFLNNFKSPLIYALVGAAIFALIIGKIIDVFVILAVLFLNALIGYFQETKAEKDIKALKQLSSFFINVFRDGKLMEINSEKLVPGDVVYLDEGDRIPADGRVFESNNLLVNESSLTGESELILKTERVVKSKKEEAPVNMVFQGTVVSEGNGKFIVLTTGAETRFGKIAEFAQKGETKTPIQKKMETLSKQIGFVVLGASLFVILIGLFSGRNFFDMVQLAISMSVSAIPEGLPVAVTIILVLGAKRMAGRKAIIRNMMAVETLGTTTVIATDKTGTLTHNKLKVVKIYAASGETYEPEPQVNGRANSISTDIRQIIFAGAICGNAQYSLKDDRVIGDATDAAILESTLSYKFHDKAYKKDEEIPFSSDRKYMAVIYSDDKKRKIILKGAPEVVLARCTYFYNGGKKQQLTIADKKRLVGALNSMTNGGLRVVAVCEKEIRKGTSINGAAKKGFTLLGYIGLKDTYRSGVKEAIEKCKRAGIKIVMLTGDHLDTAKTIAKKLGIIEKENEAIIAQDIIFEKNINKKVVGNYLVFARILPEYKYKIIEYFKNKGEIVAMTGDGVNDVPALRKADIGIAMGESGTDAAKEASDMVLVDDNFSTIVAAIEEGRTIFENLRKTLLYLISTSAGEVFTIIGSLILGLPLPITPLQILWINMITDTSATIPLGLEPKEAEHLEKPPRDTNEGIVSSLMLRRSILVGIYMAVVALIIFKSNLALGLEQARTVTFLFLSISQWFNAFNCRSEKKSIFTMNPFSNKWLLFGISLGVLGQLAVMYVPSLANLFNFVPVDQIAWFKAVLASTGLVVLIEIDKLISNKFKR